MELVVQPTSLVTMDAEQRVLTDSSLVIKGNRIAWIGPSNELPAEYHTFEKLIAPGKVLFPGFVDAHSHASLSTLRGIADNIGVAAAYSPNVPQGVFLTPAESELFARLSLVMALRYGTTCMADNYTYSHQVAQICHELGIRAVVSERLHDVDLFKVPKGVFEFHLPHGMDLLQKNIDLYQSWHKADDDRIRVRIGPHAPDTCSDAFLRQIKKAADDLACGLVIHLAQAPGEVKQIQAREGCSSVEYVNRLGLLGPNMLAGHCVVVDEQDIQTLYKTGTPISHQSVCNAKNAKTAPIKAFQDLGMTISLGSDNKASDMVEVMRTALIASRIREHDQDSLKALDVLEMGTIGGARSLQWDDEIGSLDVGKKADLTLVDYRQLHMLPVVDEVANLVHCAMGSDVSDVWVDGQWLVKDGSVLGVDIESLLKEVQQVAEAMWLRLPNGGEIGFRADMHKKIFTS